MPSNPLLAVLIIASAASDVDYGRAAPIINPSACKIMLQEPRGFLAIGDDWLTPGVRVVPGSTITRGSKIAGWDLVDLIVARCFPAAS
jgi:hypothetical protein